MDQAKQDRLKAAGFCIGDAEDFLELNDEERRLVALRVAISRAVRRCREQANLTQAQLAAKVGSSQSRIAKIEAGLLGVSVDLALRALFAVGGTVQDLVVPFKQPDPETPETIPAAKPLPRKPKSPTKTAR